MELIYTESKAINHCQYSVYFSQREKNRFSVLIGSTYKYFSTAMATIGLSILLKQQLEN